MSPAVRAIYEDGVLKPQEYLPLDDHAEVILLVLRVEEHSANGADADRVAALSQEIAAWLDRQPADAVREPIATTPAVDQQFDQALAAIRRRAGRYSLAQIQADVEAAMAEIGPLSVQQQQTLQSDLAQLFAQWASDDLS